MRRSQILFSQSADNNKNILHRMNRMCVACIAYIASISIDSVRAFDRHKKKISKEMNYIGILFFNLRRIFNRTCVNSVLGNFI